MATASLLRGEVAEFCQLVQSHRRSASTAKVVGREAERWNGQESAPRRMEQEA